MLSIEQMEKSVVEFNKKNISLSNIQNGTIRIDTPFFDRHNDELIIYALDIGNNNIRLTDNGYILDDLESDGIYISRSKPRKKTMEKYLLNYSVQVSEDDELYIDTSLNDYPIKQNLLVQAMLFVNDMFLTSNKKVASLFIHDVSDFFENNGIRVTDGPNIIGKTGMVHHYDFSIPGFKKIPEKLIKVLNTADNEYYAKSVAMDIHQTKIIRESAKFYTIINDENNVDNNIISLFESENISPILFSQRNKYIEELAE